MPYVSGVWRYTRGLAVVATGRRADAAKELAALEAIRQAVSPDRTVAGFFKTQDMLLLAAEVLAGEIAARSGDTDAAVQHLSKAVQLQDGHWFTEPPPWYYPVRQSLGAALLAGRRAPEAEAVYREDLKRNPENGWSLFGLAQSLRAQGRTADAAAVDERFRRAWARADVTLTASRFYEVVRNGGGMAYGTYFERRAKRVLDGEFSPTFMLELMRKDAMLALTLAQSVKVPAPLLEETKRTYDEGVERGWGQEDFSAVTHVIEHRIGRSLSKR